MPTCPNGHQSGSDDWCEICGHRMGAVPPPPPPPPAYGFPGPGDPSATAQAELCPQCRTPREAGAPFCEECRWNFLTNTATSYTPLAPQQPMPQPGPGPGPANGPGPGPSPVPGLNLPPAFQQGPPPAAPRDPFEYQSSRPSQVNRPAEPLAADPSPRPAQQPPNAFQPPPPPPPAFGGGQGGPPPPPPAFQQPSPPAPPQPQVPQPQVPQPQGEDDWMLPPPSQAVQGARQQTAPAQGTDDWPRTGPAQGGSAQGADDWPQQAVPARSDDDWPHNGPAQGGPAQAGPGQGGPGQGGPGQGGPAQAAPAQGGDDWPQAVPPPAPAAWAITIGPDRDYFLAMMQRSGPEAAGLNLPAYSPEQQRPLSGNQITIGRRRHSTGEAPDIDLSVPPEDPGVSHQHAVLVQQPDGTWAVVDQNSTNGTTINGGAEPIQPYVPVPLQDGDRVHVGAWTTITVRRG
ncbi:FHA domain-containing protein [Streptomyces sp. NPDC006703]|uniref:FHA domain-containing protein n=1 Tax=Streptomyces sp. NPDC006703 TaxID=3364759 RepID=UPI00368647F2